jgi:hypothetical protein
MLYRDRLIGRRRRRVRWQVFRCGRFALIVPDVPWWNLRA